VRQLLPVPVAQDVETSVAAVYGDLLARAAAVSSARPYVALNMVSSVDGAIALDGLSGGLSGSADKEVFFYLRSLTDVILVGASTAREENYGPPRLSAQLVAERDTRRQQPLPRIAVVTRSMKMDWSGRLFAPSPDAPRPYVICPASAPPDRKAAAGAVADLVTAGESGVDLAAALARLAADGARTVLCEGGPTLNGQLLSAGLVDELCLTVSPALVGGLGRRISGWSEPRPGLPLELLTVAESSGVLLLRYAVKPALHD
jgi:riboflavin biosynthesis pyrimidine reductase